MNDDRYIIVFDGVCNFCNGAVNFIIKRDPKGVFVFTPMQSEFAQNVLQQHQITNVGIDTFLLVKEEKTYIWTDAALEISKDLSGAWFLFNIFKIIPRPLRDYFYKAFARNRYRIFGRTQSCVIPNKKICSRYIGI